MIRSAARRTTDALLCVAAVVAFGAALVVLRSYWSPSNSQAESVIRSSVALENVQIREMASGVAAIPSTEIAKAWPNAEQARSRASESESASDGPGERFRLVGTVVTGNRRVAFLEELASGKFHVVAEGGVVGGVTFKAIAADRVKLLVGSRTSELRLDTSTAWPNGAVQAEPASLTLGASADASRKAYVEPEAPERSAASIDVGRLVELGQPVPNPR